MYQSPSQGILPKDDFQEKTEQDNGNSFKEIGWNDIFAGQDKTRGAAKLEANM